MNTTDDFLNGHALWEKLAKQFFEKNTEALGQFLTNPFAPGSLDALMEHFKGSIKEQQNFSDFIPLAQMAQKKFLPSMQKYGAVWWDMTNDTIELFKKKIQERIDQKNIPQTGREFYELWLECGEQVYQRWSRKDQFLSAFADMINGMVGAREK